MSKEIQKLVDDYAARMREGASRGHHLSEHLRALESESIFIMREVAANFENAVMMYSIGKDSSVMLHLALKAFFPSIPPFPLMHVDTLWKFKEMTVFRDLLAKALGMDLIIHTNEEGAAQNVDPFANSSLHTELMKTDALRQVLDKHKFDAAFGGARRDEEKSRAKERIFSVRNSSHAWDPRNQRPELWNVFNTRLRDGESIRVFPLSNWTEADIWQYISEEDIPIVPLYYAKRRLSVERDGQYIMVDDDRLNIFEGETPEERLIRFRTLGCYPLTAATPSDADTLDMIIAEVQAANTSEREGRLIDTDESASMERKKRQGYF